MIYKLKKKIYFIISIFRSSIHQLKKMDFSKKKSKIKIITNRNISHITQRDKDKVYKFIYITHISYITQSDKDKFFYKTKTIKPKTLVN